MAIIDRSYDFYTKEFVMYDNLEVFELNLQFTFILYLDY